MVTALEDKLAEALLAWERVHNILCGLDLDPDHEMRLQEFNEDFNAKKQDALNEWRNTAGNEG